MPGTGRPPNTERRRRNKPLRGEWQATPGIGWQHGEIPAPEGALLPESLAVWRTWMQSWWASHWLPADVPGLNVVIHLYDQCVDYFREPLIEKEYVTTKGDTRTTWVVKPNPVGELRQMMDNYGITPKGQQDRRWQPPKADETVAPAADTTEPRFAQLRVVAE